MLHKYFSVFRCPVPSICSKYWNHKAEHFIGILQILEKVDRLKLKPDAANGLIERIVMTLSLDNDILNNWRRWWRMVTVKELVCSHEL